MRSDQQVRKIIGSSQGVSPTIVYHDDCPDGITAAWVCQVKWLGSCKLYPARYEVGPVLERLRGEFVVVVDFSWKREAMKAVINAARTCIVLDHHKSAQAELEGLPCCTFDMNRSGCGLTWDVLFPDNPRPALINYTEDRDLWRWALPRSREINAALGSYPLTLENRRDLAERMRLDLDGLATEGATILRYRESLIDDVARKGVPRGWIGGRLVPCVSSPFRELVSDLVHRLALNEPFAAGYFDTAEGERIYSLRSTDEGEDVSEVARKYGGGGHKHAAGFTQSVADRVRTILGRG
jgi:hypothetical protein